MVVPIELYPFIPFAVAFIYFKVTAVSNSITENVMLLSDKVENVYDR